MFYTLYTPHSLHSVDSALCHRSYHVDYIHVSLQYCKYPSSHKGIATIPLGHNRAYAHPLSGPLGAVIIKFPYFSISGELEERLCAPLAIILIILNLFYVFSICPL